MLIAFRRLHTDISSDNVIFKSVSFVASKCSRQLKQMFAFKSSSPVILTSGFFFFLKIPSTLRFLTVPLILFFFNPCIESLSSPLAVRVAPSLCISSSASTQSLPLPTAIETFPFADKCCFPFSHV